MYELKLAIIGGLMLFQSAYCLIVLVALFISTLRGYQIRPFKTGYLVLSTGVYVYLGHFYATTEGIY